MRAILIVGAVVLIVLCVLVPSVWVVVRSVPESVGREIDARFSDERVVAEADRDLTNLERELRKKYTLVYTAKERMDALQQKLDLARAQLAKEEGVLKRARELLKSNQPGSTIVIGGAQYTWETLQADANDRVLSCQTLKNAIKCDEKSLGDYRGAYEQGNKAIDTEMEKIRAARIQINLDAVKLAAGRARQEAMDLSRDIAGLKLSSSPAKYHRLLKDRIREIDAADEFDRRTGVTAPEPKIAWDKELGTSQTAVDAINAYFGDAAKKPATPVAKKQ